MTSSNLAADLTEREKSAQILALSTILGFHIAHAESELSPEKKDFLIQMAGAARPNIKPRETLQMLETLYEQAKTFDDEIWRQQAQSAAEGLNEEALVFALETSGAISVCDLKLTGNERRALEQQMSWLGLSNDAIAHWLGFMNTKISQLREDGVEIEPIDIAGQS